MNRLLFVRLVVLGALTLSGALLAAPAQAQSGGVVLPASARPHGFSLNDMTKELALFSTSGNNGSLPDTPFQVLYGDPATIAFTPEGSGAVESRGELTKPPQKLGHGPAPERPAWPHD